MWKAELIQKEWTRQNVGWTHRLDKHLSFLLQASLAETASHQGEKDGQVKSYSPAKGKPKVESIGSSENPLRSDFGTYLAGPFCLLLHRWLMSTVGLELRGISESLNRHLCFFVCVHSLSPVAPRSTSLPSDLLNPWMSSQPEGTGRLRSDRAGFSSRTLAIWGIRTWHFWHPSPCVFVFKQACSHTVSILRLESVRWRARLAILALLGHSCCFWLQRFILLNRH